jgi:hypothetical protein
MTRYARRVDSTQGEVVQALRACGLWVMDCSRVGSGFPDLLVGGSALGEAIAAVEVKSRTGKLRAQQEKWREGWPARYVVLRSADEALAWVTAQRRAA